MQQAHGSVVHDVAQALLDSFQLALDALVQLVRHQEAVEGGPVGAGDFLLAAAGDEVHFWRQTVGTAEGEA